MFTLRLHGSRGGARSPEESADRGPDDDDDGEVVRLEAERKLEEPKRRREDAEGEEFERMRQKQQESEDQLEELKRKREERKKVLGEEEKQRKQELEDKKSKEQVRRNLLSLLRCFGRKCASVDVCAAGGEEEAEGGD